MSISSASQHQIENYRHRILQLATSNFPSSLYDVVMIDKASAFDFFEQSQNQSTVAVVWVSHSQIVDNENLSALYGKITDAWGQDLTPFINSVPSHIKWLGIIGCKSLNLFGQLNFSDGIQYRIVSSISNPFFRLPWITKRAQNELNGFNGTVIDGSATYQTAIAGAKATLSLARYYLKRLNASDSVKCVSKTGSEVIIKLKPGNVGSGRFGLIFENRVVGVFDSNQVTEKGESVFIPLPNDRDSLELKIVADKKSSIQQDTSQFEISADGRPFSIFEFHGQSQFSNFSTYEFRDSPELVSRCLPE